MFTGVDLRKRTYVKNRQTSDKRQTKKQTNLNHNYMKQLLLSLVALMALGANAQDIKYIMDDVEVPQGGSVVVPINIENTINCYSWEGWIGVENVNVTNGDIRLSNYEATGDRVKNIAYTKYTFDEETGELLSQEDRTDGAFSGESNILKGDDGIYYMRFVGFNIGGFTMKENSGTVAYITLSAPETVEIGSTFTGYIDHIHFGKDRGVDVTGEKIIFNIKVVENVTILDENSTTAPVAAENVNVLVKRTIKADTWSTICLPFAMSEAQVKEAFGEDVQLADFSGYETTIDSKGNIVGISVNFTSITELAANHPCIIKVSSPVSEFEAEGVNIAPQTDLEINLGNNRKPKSIIGTYTAGTLVEELALFLSNGLFYYSTGETVMKGFRAYFNFNDLLTEVDNKYGIKMRVDGIFDGINDVNIANEVEGVFTIDGKKMNSDVNRLQKGVYIIDGKKVAIK
ncbi:MAG: hypothetical protein IJ209_03265 [Bacteroidaceae bacterium]|nr:hypothetical protein [Bacteroidaceae bacterium]